MFVGGTTFPFWTCRGDIFDLYPKGTGTTTSFDFGGSPIREWGELMPGRYDWVRIFNTFCNTYKELILMSDECRDVKALAGGEEVRIIREKDSYCDATLSNSSEKFKILTNRLGDQYLVLVRNMAEDDKVVDLGWADSGKPIVKGLELKSHECFILPVNVNVPGSKVCIKQSNSSLLFAQPVDGCTVYGVFGKQGRKGELTLNVPSDQVKVLSGKVKVSGKKSARLKYVHDGMHVVRTGKDILVILDQELASKVEVLKDAVLIADTYFVRDIKQRGKKITLQTQMRGGSDNRFVLISDNGVRTVKAGREEVSVKNRKKSRQSVFSVKNADSDPVSFRWTSDWRVKTDLAEAQPDFKDGKWKVLEKPTSLEEAGLLRHGYIWFRGEFDVAEGATDLSMVFPGNDTDRMMIYVNGQQVWFGITDDHGNSVAEFGLDGIAKPGRNVIAVLYENFYHNKSHPHEGDILKYSGILKAPVLNGKVKGKKFKQSVERFKVREGLGGDLKGYAETSFKDDKWLSLEPSEKYVMDMDLGDILWMRRSFKYKCRRGWEAGVRLTIPDAKDRCLMFLNGRPLGQFEHIGPQHEFYVPEPYLDEDNVLTIILEGSKTFMDVCRGYLLEPQFDTFYDVKDVKVSLELD
jgi:hypothetical protein